MPRAHIPLLSAVALAAGLCTGCAGIGATVGHIRDLETSRTRVVPRDQIASIPEGNLVFATIPDRETLRGRFHGVNGAPGAMTLRVDDVSVPLEQVTEVVEELHDHRRMWTGFWIGASVDLFLIGGAIWLYNEQQARAIP
jgi:hypothetical protein